MNAESPSYQSVFSFVSNCRFTTAWDVNRNGRRAEHVGEDEGEVEGTSVGSLDGVPEGVPAGAPEGVPVGSPVVFEVGFPVGGTPVGPSVALILMNGVKGLPCRPRFSRCGKDEITAPGIVTTAIAATTATTHKSSCIGLPLVLLFVSPGFGIVG